MRLQTPRLLLRDLRDSDFDAVHAYASDPEVVRYTSFGPNTENETRAFLAASVLEPAVSPRRSHTFGVIERHSQRLIGGCGVTCSDATGRQLALGYCLNRTVWRQGYGKETAAELTRFGFEVLDARRMWAWVFTQNEPSARILDGLGYRREGVGKESLFARGSWHDVWTFALLRSEYEAQIRGPKAYVT
jgi:ribosomal-protein-alanine N-acetyltransferase